VLLNPDTADKQRKDSRAKSENARSPPVERTKRRLRRDSDEKAAIRQTERLREADSPGLRWPGDVFGLRLENDTDED
jgi:hypothetical protein